LIADTHALSSRVLAKELQQEGLEVSLADSIPSMLDLIRDADRERFVAVVFDILLDESLSVAKTIQNIDPSIRLIIQARFGSTVPAMEKITNISASIVRPAPLQKYIQYIHEALDPKVKKRPTMHVNPEQEMLRSLGTRHPLKILLAEDNPLNTKVALQHLKRIGYTATHAKDGVEALERCEEVAAKGEMFDVILMVCFFPFPSPFSC